MRGDGQVTFLAIIVEILAWRYVWPVEPEETLRGELKQHPVVERIQSELYVRHWLFGRDGADRRVHRLLLVEAGSADAAWTGQRRRFEAPFMLWSPHGAELEVAVNAGARGALLAIPDERLAAAATLAASSANMADLVQRTLGVRVLDRDELAQALNAVALVEREGRQFDAMTDTIIATQLSFLAALVWRAALREGSIAPRAATDLALLRRFRNLVEFHFREHRPITFYATALGISADRLHALTRRSLDRSPLQLVNERLIEEAMRELELGNLSIAEIAHRLGFGSQSYFGAAFVRRVGATPRQYRLQRQSAGRSRFEAGAPGFADWP